MEFGVVSIFDQPPSLTSIPIPILITAAASSACPRPSTCHSV